MVTQVQLNIRPVTEKDRPSLANLVHFETHVHRHLDWRPPLDWIGHQPFLMAEKGTNLIAALACPPDPSEIAWIRLLAVSSRFSVKEAWQYLWPTALDLLAEMGRPKVAAIPLQQWFRLLLEESSFVHAHNVIMLLWQRGNPLPKPGDLGPAYIRSMNFDDLPNVQLVDEAAFGSLWQNSRESLDLAFRQAAVATVAEDEEGLLGYEISTASPMGGHLARLAVHPRAQGKGFGYALVRDLLDQFERRGASRVTVNTQEENKISLGLYEKAGFRPTGEMYPVYEYRSE